MLDGFLVLARCLDDDIPLQLCPSRKSALDYAGTVTAAQVVDAARGLLNVDVSEAVCVGIVEFRDGSPAKWGWVTDLSREGVTA